jgi:hypothetical protein
MFTIITDPAGKRQVWKGREEGGGRSEELKKSEEWRVKSGVKRSPLEHPLQLRQR